MPKIKLKMEMLLRFLLDKTVSSCSTTGLVGEAFFLTSWRKRLFASLTPSSKDHKDMAIVNQKNMQDKIRKN